MSMAQVTHVQPHLRRGCRGSEPGCPSPLNHPPALTRSPGGPLLGISRGRIARTTLSGGNPRRRSQRQPALEALEVGGSGSPVGSQEKRSCRP